MDLACDDGNTEGGDGCSAMCTFEECGNGILDVGEACDDGDDDDADGCSNDCALPVCGDGAIGWTWPFEGFETGDLTQLPWTSGSGGLGFAPSDTAVAAHGGSFGLVSQNAGDHSSTAWAVLNLGIAEDGEVCFWFSGESESGYDFFRFLIDGIEQIEESGTVSWREVCYAVSAGDRTFRWEYEKDSSLNSGRDRFAVDDVRFPPIVEACDDGNTDPGDGCGSNCLVE